MKTTWVQRILEWLIKTDRLIATIDQEKHTYNSSQSFTHTIGTINQCTIECMLSCLYLTWTAWWTMSASSLYLFVTLYHSQNIWAHTHTVDVSWTSKEKYTFRSIEMYKHSCSTWQWKNDDSSLFACDWHVRQSMTWWISRLEMINTTKQIVYISLIRRNEYPMINNEHCLLLWFVHDFCWFHSRKRIVRFVFIFFNIYSNLSQSYCLLYLNMILVSSINSWWTRLTLFSFLLLTFQCWRANSPITLLHQVREKTKSSICHDWQMFMHIILCICVKICLDSMPCRFSFHTSSSLCVKSIWHYLSQ
jgi:hypothetical protein